MNYYFIIMIINMFLLAFFSVYYYNKNKKILAFINLLTLVMICFIGIMPLLKLQDDIINKVTFIISIITSNILNIQLINIFTYFASKYNKKALSVLFIIIYYILNKSKFVAIYYFLRDSNVVFNQFMIYNFVILVFFILGLVFINSNNIYTKNGQLKNYIKTLFKWLLAVIIYIVIVAILWNVFEVGLSFKLSYPMFRELIDDIFYTNYGYINDSIIPFFVKEYSFEFSIISWILLVFFSVYYYSKKNKILALLNFSFYIVFIIRVVDYLLFYINVEDGLLYQGTTATIDYLYLFGQFFIILILINLSVYFLKFFTKHVVRIAYVSFYILINLMSVLNTIVNIKTVDLKFVIISTIYLMFALFGLNIINRTKDIPTDRKFVKNLLIMFIFTAIFIGTMYYLNNLYDTFVNFKLLYEL